MTRLEGEAFRKRFNEVSNQFDDMIRKNGWASHYIPYDNRINYHTHGVELTYNHLDFQITFPMPMESAHHIAGVLVQAVKDGEKFEEGKEYVGYLVGEYKLSFKKYMENGRDVLRVLLPDENNRLPHEQGCKGIYKKQLMEIPN